MSAALMATWDGLSPTAIAAQCRVPRVQLHAETTSTLDDAHALAEQGSPAGTLVVADSQRMGRGRQGRGWSSRPGRGVWCTLVERPRDTAAVDVMSIRVGLGLAEALDSIASHRVMVKWPNDLILRGKKVGGILIEARWSGTTLAWVAIGVGINVVAPPGLPDATGLADDAPRTAVLYAIVPAIRSAAAQEGHLSRDELAQFRARDFLLGRQIIAPGVGRVAGIAASGALIVETAGGSEQHRSGTIRMAEVLDS